MELKVLGVLETISGLEVQILENGRTISASIPQEVLEPRANQFRVEAAGEGVMRVVYHLGKEQKVYEALIKR